MNPSALKLLEFITRPYNVDGLSSELKIIFQSVSYVSFFKKAFQNQIEDVKNPFSPIVPFEMEATVLLAMGRKEEAIQV